MNTETAATSTVASNDAQPINPVYTFGVGPAKELWAYIQPWKGNELAHIRLFGKKKTGEWYPTRVGISLEPKQMHKLLMAVVSMMNVVEERDGE